MVLSWFSHGSLMVLSWFSLMVLSWFSFAVCLMCGSVAVCLMVLSWFVSLLHMFHSIYIYIYHFLHVVLFRKPLGQTLRETL